MRPGYRRASPWYRTSTLALILKLDRHTTGGGAAAANDDDAAAAASAAAVPEAVLGTNQFLRLGFVYHV